MGGEPGSEFWESIGDVHIFRGFDGDVYPMQKLSGLEYVVDSVEANKAGATKSTRLAGDRQPVGEISGQNSESQW